MPNHDLIDSIGLSILERLPARQLSPSRRQILPMLVRSGPML